MAQVRWLHTADEWETMKPVIRQLYLEEFLPLRQVVEQMQEIVNFHATPDMYKERFAKWGFRKNLKTKDALAIMQKKRMRVAVHGKQTSVKVGHMAVDSKRLDKHLRRKFHNTAELMSAVNHPTDISKTNLRCVTPPVELCLSNHSTGGHHILTAVRDYFSSSFENNRWISTVPSMDCYSSVGSSEDMIHLKDLFSQTDLACSLFDDGRMMEAGSAVQKACAKLGGILSAEHPRMLTAFFDLAVSVIRRRRSEIATLMLQQISALSQINFQKTHPVVRIFTMLLAQPYADCQAALILAWRYAVDELETLLGKFHYTALRCRLEYVQMAIGLDDVDLAHQTIAILVDECERQCGPHDIRTMKLFETQAEITGDMGLLQECTLVANKLFTAATEISFWNHDISVQLTCSGLYSLPRCQLDTGLAESAAENLRYIIDLSRTSQQYNSALAAKYLLSLERCTRARSNEA